MQWLKYFPNLGNFFKKLIIKRIESLTIVQVARCKSLGFIKRILSCPITYYTSRTTLYAIIIRKTKPSVERAFDHHGRRVTSRTTSTSLITGMESMRTVRMVSRRSWYLYSRRICSRYTVSAF